MEGCKKYCAGKRGLRRHKSITHGIESKEERECPACGETFKRYESVETTYCSQECAYEGRVYNQRERFDLECEHCEETFEVQRHELDSRRFCGQECWNEWQREN